MGAIHINSESLMHYNSDEFDIIRYYDLYYFFYALIMSERLLKQVSSYVNLSEGYYYISLTWI